MASNVLLMDCYIVTWLSNSFSFKLMLALDIAASTLFLPKNAKGGDCWRFELA